MTNQTELPRWDLSGLYASPDDPQIPKDLATIASLAQSFHKRYAAPFSDLQNLSPNLIQQALQDYLELLEKINLLSSFSSLSYSVDTQNTDLLQLQQKVQEHCSKASESLLFFSLQLAKLPDNKWEEILQDDSLKPFHYFISRERELAAHNLSEREETLLEKTSNCRGSAFRKLFTEYSSAWEFPMEKDGQVQQLTLAQLSAYNYHSDRELRQKAFDSLSSVIKSHAKVPTFVMNTLLHEKFILDDIRGFRRADESRHLANDLPPEVVDTMVEVTQSHHHIVADYYKLKQRLLGQEALTQIDRYAPIFESNTTFSYDQARDIVIESFAQFSPDFSKIAQQFFDDSWIDVPTQAGKRSGAFCAGVTPKHHPYILLNFTGKHRDITTLAHELGHGIHDVLASNNHLIDYHPVLPLAETASTFCEQLVFDSLYSQAPNKKEQLSLLCSKLEDGFATIFRQTAMYSFEQSIHQHRREHGLLSTETFNSYWQQHQQAMFGDSLTLEEDHAYTWLYIPHIYHTPFYVYAYAFGDLLVMSLYHQYQEQGSDFIESYRQLLSAGGSAKPLSILQRAGMDITEPRFWEFGFSVLQKRLETAKQLAKELGY